MPFQIIDATGNVKTARTVTGGALLAAQNTFSNTSGQIIQGPLDLTAATAGQIKFPASQNASADVNTLDDYEEGTWTPVIGGASSTSGQTYLQQVGYYIKIGQMVMAWFYPYLTAKGTMTGAVGIHGLPFTSLSGMIGGGGSIYYVNTATNWYVIGCLMDSNATSATLFGTSTLGVSSVQLAAADIGNGTAMLGAVYYRASA